MKCTLAAMTCMYPLVHTHFGLVIEGGMQLGRGRMQQRTEETKYIGFTRFVINTFTLAA